jgi:CarD family transcriptional regulator
VNANPQKRRSAYKKKNGRVYCATSRPRVGDKAVCPPHGVAEVVAIGPDPVSGAGETFYSLRILGNGLRIMIPARKVKASGVREIIGASQADEVFAVIKRRSRSARATTWSKWQRQCLTKLQSGSILDAAEVLRDVYRLKADKDLSLSERRLFDRARELVVTELAIATGRSTAEVEAKIRSIVGRPS